MLEQRTIKPFLELCITLATIKIKANIQDVFEVLVSIIEINNIKYGNMYRITLDAKGFVIIVQSSK